MIITYFTFHRNNFFLFLYFTDIDECLSDPCHINANCTDNEGSYDCQCNVGYSGNGFNCSSKLICSSKFIYVSNISTYLLVAYCLLFLCFCRQ